MNREKFKYGLACIMSLLFLPACASAYDMIMPSVDIVIGMLGWQVLLLSLLAEMVIVKLFLKESILKTVLITFIMNLVSLALGIIAVPLAGLIIELLFFAVPVGTYHISHWIVNFVAITALYAVLEALTIKIIFKHKVKKTFPWLCLANAISILICFLFNLFWLEHMHI